MAWTNQVVIKAVKDQLTQARAIFKSAKFPFPQKRKWRIARLQTLQACGDDSDAEDDDWSMKQWLREPRLDRVYQLPANKLLDPKKSAGSIHERVYVWRQRMCHRAGAHIRIAKQKATSKQPFDEFVSSLRDDELSDLLRHAAPLYDTEEQRRAKARAEEIVEEFAREQDEFVHRRIDEPGAGS